MTGLQYVEFLEGDGATIFEHACRLGLEGIVCKRADSPYRAGPSKTWLKVKNRAHPSVARVKDAIEAGEISTAIVSATPIFAPSLHPARK